MHHLLNAPQSRLAVDSVEARRQFQMCQKCCKSKNEVRRLFTCAGCRVTLYCSKECQKAHWRTHKAMCKIHQDRHVELAKLDGQMRSGGVDSSAAGVLPSQFVEELRSFTARFGAALFQAGFNAIRIPEFPQAWTQMIFYVMLERLVDVPPDSRFRVVDAESVPVLDLYTLWGEENAEKFVEQKAINDKRHQEVGSLGTLAIILVGQCVDPPLVVNNSTFVAFESNTQGEIEISHKWMDTLVQTVEKLSGRLPAAASSR